jgi:tetratricopeptide (TPR) repeat protein
VRVCALALLVCLAAGCAAHRSPDTTSLFVHRSRATYEDGATFDAPGAAGTKDAPKADGDSGSARAQAIPDPSVPKSPQPKSSDSPTLESTTPNLAAIVAAVRLHPSADGYVALGTAYHRLGVLDEAENNFQRALQFNGKSAPAYEGLARVWRDWGLPEYGLGDAYRAVSIAPHSASAHNTLGTLLFALGDPEVAKTHFQRSLALDATAGYALNNLCYVSFMLGEGGPAVARCTEALALAPDAVTTRNNLALVYAAQGKPDEAAREFAKASDGPAASYNVGIAHMARHEYQDAAAAFTIACNAKPEVAGACAWAKEARRKMTPGVF